MHDYVSSSVQCSGFGCQVSGFSVRQEGEGLGRRHWRSECGIKEAQLDATREVSMGKLLASRVLIKVADGCLQMFGGLGLMNEMRISRYYRDARGLAIGGGADEVMREILAKLEGY